MSKYPGYEWDGTSSESSEDNWNQKSKSDGYNWDGGILEESKQDSLLRSHFSAIDLSDNVSQWEIKPDEIQIISKIGKGSFGVVFKGTLRGQEVAIKKLFKTNLDQQNLENFRREVAIMSKLRHPHVLLFMGACIQNGDLMIICELMKKGSVYDLLHNKDVQLSFQMRMKFAKDAAVGMNWLHRSNPIFIHRDLKTGNLLVDDNWNVKISDFGLSHVKEHTEGTVGSYGSIGTPLWMAPEVLLGLKYSETADIYSFGIVLWELLTQSDIFQDVDSYRTLVQEVCINHKRPDIPNDCAPLLSSLIQECWQPTPEKRPSFHRMLQDFVFDKIVVQTKINDIQARKFWEKYFLGEWSVSIKEFMKAFHNFWAIYPIDQKSEEYLCLSAICKDGKDEVTIERFNKILNWFGPMENGRDFLRNIVELLREPYFHGDLSQIEAEKKLKEHKKPLSFLVRFSANDSGCYAISALNKDLQVQHIRVHHKPGTKFAIGKTEVSSLQSIIRRYGTDLGLIHPYPGPFQEIFYYPERDEINSPKSIGYLIPTDLLENQN